MSDIVFNYLCQRTMSHLEQVFKEMAPEDGGVGFYSHCEDHLQWENEKEEIGYKIIYYEQCQAQKELLTLSTPNSAAELKKYQWQIRYEFVNIHQMTDYRQQFVKQANKSELRAAIKQEFSKIEKMEKSKSQDMTIKQFLETFPCIENLCADPKVKFRFCATEGWNFSNAQKIKITKILNKCSVINKGPLNDLNEIQSGTHPADGEIFECSFKGAMMVFQLR